MKITSLANAPSVPYDIDGRIMFSGNSFEVVHLSLSPGEELALHDNPHNVVFYMLEGSAFLILKDSETEMKSDSCLALEKGISRGWCNRGDSRARLLVIKY